MPRDKLFCFTGLLHNNELCRIEPKCISGPRVLSLVDPDINFEDDRWSYFMALLGKT